MKHISIDDYEETAKKRNVGKYRFNEIRKNSPVEYSENETGKTVKYLACKLHEHGSKTDKRFQTHSYCANGDRFLRVLRVL